MFVFSSTTHVPATPTTCFFKSFLNNHHKIDHMLRFAAVQYGCNNVAPAKEYSEEFMAYGFIGVSHRFGFKMIIGIS